MENDALKNELNKDIQSQTSGRQKFLLGLISGLALIAFVFFALKFSHFNFLNIDTIKKDSIIEQVGENLTDKEAYRTNLENQTAKKVQSVLEKIVGNDNVSVQVNAEIDFNSTKATIEKYKPINGSLTEKEIKQVVSEPGAIKRITVAVAVNKALTSKEKQELTDLVASASGVDFSRGDAVSVSDLRFLGLAEVKDRQSALEKRAILLAISKTVLNDILPLCLILAVFLIIIKAIGQFFKPSLRSEKDFSGSVQTSINYDNYKPDLPVKMSDENSLNNEQQENDNSQQEVSAFDIGQIREELGRTIMADAADAAKLLSSYIKD